MENAIATTATEQMEQLFRLTMLREVAFINSYGKAKREFPEKGVLAGMTSEKDLAVLQQAYRATKEQLAPVDENMGWLIDDLTDLAGLIHITASPEQVENWVRLAIKYLHKLPAQYLRLALAEAPHSCRYLNEVVPFVTKETNERANWMTKHFDAIEKVLIDVRDARR